MAAVPTPWTPSAPQPTSTLLSADPNELLRRIDQNTAQTFTWVKYGMAAVIILLVLIALGV
jgi:hypothetical protein